MRLCQLPVLIVAALSILMVGCSEVPFLVRAAKMDSVSPSATSPEEDKLSEAQKEAEKLADVRRLLEMTRAQNIFQQISGSAFQETMANIREMKPDIPDKYLVVIEGETKRVVHEGMIQKGGLLDMLSVLYAERFTHDEIKDILAFYETEAGQKVILASPDLMQEVGQTTAQWGATLDPVIQQRVIERLGKEGLELSQ